MYVKHLVQCTVLTALRQRFRIFSKLVPGEDFSNLSMIKKELLNNFLFQTFLSLLEHITWQSSPCYHPKQELQFPKALNCLSFGHFYLTAHIWIATSSLLVRTCSLGIRRHLTIFLMIAAPSIYHLMIKDVLFILLFPLVTQCFPRRKYLINLWRIKESVSRVFYNKIY